MNKVVKLLTGMVVASTLCCIFSTGAQAAQYKNKSFEFKQPDGTKVHVKITGDEYFQQVESLDGYTLCTDKDGWICYAKLNDDGSDYVSTGEVYKENENSTNTNLTKHIKLSKSAINKKANVVKKELHADALGDQPIKTNNISNSLLNSKLQFKPLTSSSSSKTTTKVKGLTILINFSDEESSISKSAITNFFNQDGYTGYDNNGSVRDFFYDVSGGKLTYTNDVLGFYTAKHAKSYYVDSSAASGDFSKALELTREALDWAESSGYDFSTLSTNSDGNVKAVNILYAGETGTWDKGIWPHKGYLTTKFSADGVGVQEYEMSNIGTDLSLYTICHENGHLICGYPDLYDDDSAGVGNYSLMSTCVNEKNPAPPDPYCRNIISGWNTTTSLNSLSNSTAITATSNGTANQNVYKWSGSSSSEYFLIENIQKTGRYADMPASGLAIWHVDESGDNSKQDMTSSSHYQVSLEQADGKYDLENGTNSGDSKDLFYKGNNASFTKSTTPNSKLWSGKSSGLNISQISSSGTNMTFVKSSES